MEKALSQQIDTLAQRILQDALPPTWIINELHEDFGKDYLVEIGAGNGELTGTTFYIQLKGQQKVKRAAKKAEVSFSLETRHTTYFLDKIKDLPLFLVVVDVAAKDGWWVHVQPQLEKMDPKWRRQKTVTVKLPTSNHLADIEKLAQAVVEAHRKMRLLHPAALSDIIDARREHIRSLDPRFDIALAIDALGKPVIQLYSMQEISLKMQVLGGKPAHSKLSDLFGKGAIVEFSPGEIRISGSKVFEKIEFFGGTMSVGRSSPGTVTFVARDADGCETARLNDIPGNFTGGTEELWFNAELKNSPLTIRLGPIAKAVGGFANITLSLTKWDGQNLRHLAHFDRLYSFFSNLASYEQLDVLLEINGNSAGLIPTKCRDIDRLVPVCEMLVFIHKARKVAEHFGLNPMWRATPITTEQEKDVEDLYDILFNGGRTEATPNFVITLIASNRQLEVTNSPATIQFIEKWRYDVLSQEVDVTLVRQTTHVIVTACPAPGGTDTTSELEVTATATPQSQTMLRLATDDDMARVRATH